MPRGSRRPHSDGGPAVLLSDDVLPAVQFRRRRDRRAADGACRLLAYGGDALKVYVAHEHWLVCPTHVLWKFNHEPCDERACTRCVLAYRRPPQLWRYTGALERRLADVDLFIARSEFSRAK